MPYNLSAKKGVVFGAGEMAVEYCKILQALSAKFTVVGRNEAGMKKFFKKTGIQALANGFTAWEKLNPIDTEYAIVAVNVEGLAKTAIQLMDFGIRNILLEKPGGLTPNEIQRVRDRAQDTKTKILMGYNRRYYASVMKAKEIIEDDVRNLKAQMESIDFVEVLNRCRDYFSKFNVDRREYFVNRLLLAQLQHSCETGDFKIA